MRRVWSPCFTVSHRKPMLLLASASPRRRELLLQVGFDVFVRPVDIDESFVIGAPAVDEAVRIARAKAAAVGPAPGCIAGVVADTVVWKSSGAPLGKPRDRADAAAMLAELAGTVHTVTTAFAVTSPVDGAVVCCRAVDTRVRFRSLERNDIAAYLDTDEPWDKAGSYAIQGLAGLFVESIEGSFSNVVGLPVADVVADLRRHALLDRWPWEAR